MDWKEEYFKRIEAEKKLEEALARIRELEAEKSNLWDCINKIDHLVDSQGNGSSFAESVEKILNDLQ